MSTALEQINRSDKSITTWRAILGTPTRTRRGGPVPDAQTLTWTRGLRVLGPARVVAAFTSDGRFLAVTDWSGLAAPPPGNLIPAPLGHD